MQTEAGDKNSGVGDYEDEQEVIPIFTTDNDENEPEGSPSNIDTNEVEIGSGLVGLTLPQPSPELVQLLYMRLSDIVANIADYPPAQHYIRSSAPYTTVITTYTGDTYAQVLQR